ncbi:MAG: DUF6438 domain-containing protein [Thermoproteota archaeon]
MGTVPFIAGLVVGIAFVIILALVIAAEMSRPIFTIDGRDHFRPDRYEHVNISINGLHDRYAIDEPIDFSVHFLGFTPTCDVAPTVKIIETGSNKVVYSYDPFYIGICTLGDFVNDTMTFADLDGAGDIVFERGKYEVIVEQYGTVAEREFTVSDDPSDIVNIVFQFDETAIQPPDIDKLKVYIFPRDPNRNISADDLDWELGVIAGVNLAYGYYDGFGASKLGIYDRDGKIIVPNGTDFYISPDLKKSDGSPMKVEDIDDQHKFGSDVMVGDIPLKPKGVGQISELVPAITFVVAEPDIRDTDSKIELIRDSINEPKLVKVVIPEGASVANSGKTYDPPAIKVVIGYNNTVRWVNNDTVDHFIEADDNTDPDFYRKTTYADPNARLGDVISTGESFIYTFTKAGEIGYHGKPWMRGTVIVLEDMQQISGAQQSILNTDDDLQQPLIRMEKDACDGTCPEYSVEIFENGVIVFEGGDYVAVQGTHTSTISQKELEELIRDFYEIDFFSLENVYGDPFADGAERVEVSALINGTAKTVTADYGPEVPDELLHLQEKIDEIAGTEKWVLCPDGKPIDEVMGECN